MSSQSMTRDRFLREYRLELDKEFEYGDHAAQWAPNDSGPRLWGSEYAIITFPDATPSKRGRSSTAAALSPDSQILAIATDTVIRMYDFQSRQMLSELVGHLSNVCTLLFVQIEREGNDALSPGTVAVDAKHSGYTLLSESDEVRGSAHGQILRWNLDAKARQIDKVMPFAVNAMADTALAAISADLREHHSLSEDDLKSLRTGFVESLRFADAKNQVKHLAERVGHFPSFGTRSVSHDGKSMLYTAHGETTQDGMRPPEDLPQIVIVDVATQTERCRLKGHEDKIMWAGWSPDDSTIATASWDERYKIWDARTGECRHTIGPTDGQNWSGAFSPDGKHVLLSGGRPVKVPIYDVETGQEFKKLESLGLKLDHWIRYFSWSPKGDHIALVNGRSVILWEPYRDRIGTILRLKTDGTMLMGYNGFPNIKWSDDGELLLLQDTEDTTFVWDKGRNRKWRFQRPQGTELHGDSDVFYVAKTQTIVTLDGDRKVRYWQL